MILSQLKNDGGLDIAGLTSFGNKGVDIVDDNTYRITDMELTDTLGTVKYTISKTVLYPNKKTRGHIHDNTHETYYFINGKGLILLQSEQQNDLFHIEPETWIFIPKKTFHMVINTSKNEDLEFMTFYPGKSDRPQIKPSGEPPAPKENKKK